MKTDGYSWTNGATLDDHSRRKHAILRDYFRQYLTVRCQIAQQTKFRLAIVDGFAGGGRYSCGTAGSPILFIEELERTLDEINVRRAAQGMGAVEVDALLIFNDAQKDVTAMLQSHCAPLEAALKAKPSKLHIQIAYFSEEFETAYPGIKQLIVDGRFRNVLYNLDQYGYAGVTLATLQDILRTPSAPSTEVFYTFAIETLLTYLSARDPELLKRQLAQFDITPANMSALEGLMTKDEWLGAAERLVFDALKSCARYVSPFSIRNPKGWRYWMLHFANNYRARQEYNMVLHGAGELAHFGRSGLHMLHYNPAQDGRLYLFDNDGRVSARDQLVQDIPRLVSESGDAMPVGEFYEAAYSETPAHKDDIHAAMLSSEDLEIATPNGGVRRSANTIDVGDIIRLKNQRSFFQMFSATPKLLK
ncbi:three-Cys-motif partner protein TcmP [Phenylobacterium sp.]|uniref:three-Cys-motif partner protein TcmP n=1 Tax=Phenylobacterium sp. TaxID=1871053 RepID=UPI0035B124A2